MVWGSTYKSNLEKVQIKQNHIIRLIFFATLYGKETESAKPLLNLLDILSVHNVYCLHVLKFTHLWHRGMLPIIFGNIFRYARNVHSYNTRLVSTDNLFKSSFKTNIGKQTISFMANDLSPYAPEIFKYVFFHKASKIAPSHPTASTIMSFPFFFSLPFLSSVMCYLISCLIL